MLLAAASALDDVYQTLFTQPLIDPQLFQAFYRPEVNAVRGADQVEYMVRGLHRSHGGAHYKSFLMGHPGVGKSTEMTRLSQMVEKQYRVVRFSAQTDLDAGGFRPFDVLLVMMIQLAEETAKPVSQGGTGERPSQALIDAIYRWFATEEQTVTGSAGTTISAAGGAKPSPVTWAALLGLFAELKGEIKYTADRKTVITEYRLGTINQLIDLLNQLLDECNALLQKRRHKEWLFIGEDFDKPGIEVTRTEALFLDYANIFHELRTHMIFTIPIVLAYSERAARLPLPYPIIPDTPVFDKRHGPHADGRAAVEAVLRARVEPALFEEGQMTRLIVASGGNLRDLFELVSKAADTAAIRTDGKGRISPADVALAVNDKRSDYVRRLGVSPYDPPSVTYEEKAKRLLTVYNQEPGYDVPDPVLHSLLRARAVQEFNGERWFGVHPLVVDILSAQRKLKPVRGKPAAGGTN